MLKGIRQTEERGKKRFQEDKYAVSIIDDKEFTKKGNAWKLEANDFQKNKARKTNETQLKR